MDSSLDRKDWALSLLLVVTVAGVGLFIWWFVAWYFELPTALLPSPAQCWDAGLENRQVLFDAVFKSTGLASVAGLATSVVLGALLAMVFSQSRKLRLALFPYIILLQTVPIVAIAPLLIIWSGYTFRTVLIVTVIVSLFPIVNSVTTGLLSIDKDEQDLFRLYRAGRFKTLRSLQIPSAVQHLVIGAKTSAALAVIGAIVAEFFVGDATNFTGLGTLMTGWQALAKTDALIAALFCSAFLGLALFGFVHLASVTVLRRWVVA